MKLRSFFTKYSVRFPEIFVKQEENKILYFFAFCLFPETNIKN